MLGLEMVFRGFTQAKSDSVKPFHAEFYRIIIKRAAFKLNHQSRKTFVLRVLEKDSQFF